MRIPSVFVFFIVVVFFSNITSAQEFWELLNFPDSVTVRCMDSNSEGHIFVGVGGDNEMGGVYRSFDKGLNWDCVLNIGEFNVLTLDIDINDRIYCGKRGFDRLLFSDDHGETWNPIVLPESSQGNIQKIYCVESDTILFSSWESFGSYMAISFDSGQTWQTNYVTDKSNEYISDIAVNDSGEVFVSASGFFDGQGGIYKSNDWGESWDYVGLLNHQVLTIEINSQGDVFTGDWWVMNNDQPGIYALYNGSDEFELILSGGEFTDVAITSDDHLYVAASRKIYYSFSNGQNFYAINDTLSDYMDILMIDYESHLYAGSYSTIVRSRNPIVTGEDKEFLKNPEWMYGCKIYPNPVRNGFNLIYESCKHSSFSIYNSYGVLVFSGEILVDSFGGYYDITHLQQGYYFLCFSNSATSISFLKL